MFTMSVNLEIISEPSTNEPEQRPPGTPIHTETNTNPELPASPTETSRENPQPHPATIPPSQRTIQDSARINLEEHLAPEGIPTYFEHNLQSNQEESYDWSCHLFGQCLQTLTQSV